MLRKSDHISRTSPTDGTIIDVIRKALDDNAVRIPFTNDGGYIATDISETGTDEDLHITITGYYSMPGQMCQQVTVIYFDTVEKANRFRRSPEGASFEDPYGDGQDSFDYNTYAGDPRLPELIATILRNYFDIKDNSHIVAHTYCEVDYFRKDSSDKRPRQMKS